MLTSLAVILILTQGAFNILKMVKQSTSCGADSETDAHNDVIFPAICDNQKLSSMAAVVGCCPC